MNRREFKAKARAIAKARISRFYSAQAFVDAKREQMKRIPACGCGRVISANKKACRECASVPFVDLLA